MRNETKSERSGWRRRKAGSDEEDAETAIASEYAELLAIPRLGEVRAKSLADIGIKTLADLNKTSEAVLAKVKWVGAGNARLIKQWLADHGHGKPSRKSAVNAAPAKPARRRASASRAVTKVEPPTDDFTSAIPATSNEPDESVADGPISDSAIPFIVTEQEILQEDRTQIDSAINRLKESIPKKSRDKKLGRQLDKVASSVSEVPTTLNSLRSKEKATAAKALDRIARLLAEAVEDGKLSAKKQESMGAELKKFRKRLEKALGG